MKKKNEYKTFLTICEKLNRKFHLVPVLYGSLGLSKCIGRELRINDIDILVPEKSLKGEWQKLQDFMFQEGYKLIDEHEHEFEKKGIIVAFGREEGLKEVEVDIAELETVNEAGAKFKTLSAHDYKTAYVSLQKDPYRRARKYEADLTRIKMINEFLKNKNRYAQRS